MQHVAHGDPYLFIMLHLRNCEILNGRLETVYSNNVTLIKTR